MIDNIMYKIYIHNLFFALKFLSLHHKINVSISKYANVPMKL